MHIDVQFAGLLHFVEEEPKPLTAKIKTKPKKKKITILFSIVHTYIGFGAILLIHAVLKRPAPFP